MMGLYVRLAMRTAQPLSELMEWEPRALSTALAWLEERDRAEAREANKGS